MLTNYLVGSYLPLLFFSKIVFIDSQKIKKLIIYKSPRHITGFLQRGYKVTDIHQRPSGI